MVKRWMKVCMQAMALGSSLTAFASGWYNNNNYGSSGCCTPCATPCCEDNAGWYVEGEYLYWQARQEGLDAVRFYSVPVPTTGVVLAPIDIDASRPRFDWSSGFRVGVGYEAECDNWYTGLNYTHFYNSTDRSVFAPDLLGGGYAAAFREPFPTFLSSSPLFTAVPPFLPVLDSFASEVNWKLNYNVVDWEFGTDFGVCQSLTFTPFIGFRAAAICQNYNTASAGTVLALGVPTFAFAREEQAKNIYHAGGIRAGADFMWDWFSGLGFYAKFSGSVLYGRYQIDDRFTEVVTTLGGAAVSTSFLNDNRRFWRVKANVEGALGIEWSQQFCDSSLSLRVGYEISHWFDQNQLPGRIAGDQTNTGDFSLQGLQVKACYQF